MYMYIMYIYHHVYIIMYISSIHQVYTMYIHHVQKKGSISRSPEHLVQYHIPNIVARVTQQRVEAHVDRAFCQIIRDGTGILYALGVSALVVYRVHASCVLHSTDLHGERLSSLYSHTEGC